MDDDGVEMAYWEVLANCCYTFGSGELMKQHQIKNLQTDSCPLSGWHVISLIWPNIGMTEEWNGVAWVTEDDLCCVGCNLAELENSNWLLWLLLVIIVLINSSSRAGFGPRMKFSWFDFSAKLCPDLIYGESTLHRKFTTPIRNKWRSGRERELGRRHLCSHGIERLTCPVVL